MKKYFIFAAIAAAGLFASCSSSDDAVSEVPQPIVQDGEELMPIQIGVGSNMNVETRGTGTVGGVDNASNIWNGQKINVLMYKITDGAPTFDFQTDADQNILYDDNVKLVTPFKAANLATGEAKEIATGDPYTDASTATYKVKYYPSQGRSDFWGYYLGDVTTSTALADGTGDAAGTKVVGFTIEGDNDIMVAKAATGNATTGAVVDAASTGVVFTEAQASAVTSTPKTNAYKVSYSNAAARRGLQPELVFHHLLTRLTFEVKAGNTNSVGVKVKEIKVHSKASGKVVVAYDYTDAQSAFNDLSKRIVWDELTGDPAPTYKEYPLLSLKRRITAAEDAVYEWVASTTEEMGETVPTEVETTAATLGAAVYSYNNDHAATSTDVDKFVRFYKNNNGEAGYQEGTGENADVLIGIAKGVEAYPAVTAADVDKMMALKPVTLTDDSRTTPIAVGEALLVAPQDKYWLEVVYDASGVLSKEWNTGNQATTGLIPVEPLKADIKRATANDVFERGKSYKVTITLYSPEQIKITTTLEAWTAVNEDITIDEDEGVD